MMIGRLGKNGKMVFCGDITQVDLKNKKESGISFFKILESKTDNVKTITLLKNHRHEAVEGILKIYEEYRD
jgi:phosphate starvation-inducible PhoH-like protein